MEMRKPLGACAMGMLLVVFLASNLSCLNSESPDEGLLHRAVTSNDISEARRLSESGADPNFVPFGQDLPLIEAVQSENSEMVQVLLEAGADVNARDIWGRSALTTAFELANIGMVEALLEAGADPSHLNLGELLHRAVTSNDIRAARWLLEFGADPNLPFGQDLPLIEAVQSENSEMVQVLLEAGAGPQAQDIWGNSALMAALELGNTGMVEVLLEAGTKPDEAAMRHYFKGRWIEDTENFDLVRILLESGMSPDTTGFGGTPLLVEAIDAQEPVLVRMLLDAGANPNAVDELGRSALVRAVTYFHVFRLDLTEVEPVLYDIYGQDAFRLFSYAASPRLRHRIPDAMRDGASANSALIIALAIQNGPHADLRSEYDVGVAIQVLLELGADTNGLLSTAVRRGDEVYFRGLLEVGANPYRSFQVETVGGDVEIVQALLGAGAEPDDALARAVAPAGWRFSDGPELRKGAPDANVWMVQALLQAGADPGAPGQEGRLPLVEAVFSYQFEIAELLIEAGITPAVTAAGNNLELLLSTGVLSVGDGSLRPGDQWGQLAADSAFASADLASGLGRGFAGSFSGLTGALTGTGTGVAVEGGITDVLLGR